MRSGANVGVCCAANVNSDDTACVGLFGESVKVEEGVVCVCVCAC